MTALIKKQKPDCNPHVFSSNCSSFKAQPGCTQVAPEYTDF